jgi:hypothetical protein
MRLLLILGSLLIFNLAANAQRSLMEIHDEIKASQLSDTEYNWKLFGSLNFEVAGTQNSGEYILNIEAGTTVRMYLISLTDCIPYFDVRDPQTRYVFGSSDRASLETEIDGYKAITALYTYEKDAMMNIRFGVRWGCPKMLRTKLKLLIFYTKDN